MMDPLSAAILDAATDPALTPFRATAALRAAGAEGWGVYELTDRRLWVRMGADWATPVMAKISARGALPRLRHPTRIRA